MNRNQVNRRHQQKRISKQAQKSDCHAFFNQLTSPELFHQVEALLPAHRERYYPPTETLSMFLAQVMSADRSCQAIVNDAAIKRLISGLSACSTHTGGYCQARKRLPLEMVSTLARFTGQMISHQAAEHWHWRGRPVRLVDGATVSLPDTPENQDAYPQPGNQKPGLGFPLCRIVGIVCLGSGALMNMAMGPCQGKGSDEQSLLRSLLNTLKKHDVLLGDAFYATYFLMYELQKRGIAGVFEQYGARRRSTDYRLGKRLGAKDHLIEISKPKNKPQWMTQAAYDQTPKALTIRELQANGKTLVTTLLCPKQTSKSELKALYRDRWHIELDIRNIKTTLGMETLSCKTPQMVEKEIWVYLLAYNLIRLLMAQAAFIAKILPREISFKHALQLWISWRHHNLLSEEECINGLFVLMAQQRVANRGGRIEPRVLKRRLKPFPLLTEPRSVAREKIKKYGHPRKLK